MQRRNFLKFFGGGIGVGFAGNELPRKTAPGSFQDVDFRWRNLAGKDFSGVRLTRCRFDGAILSRASFRHAELIECSFSTCQMTNINFSDALLRDCTMGRSEMPGASFAQSRFIGICNLDGSNLEATTFERAHLCGILFLSGAILGKARFRGLTSEDQSHARPSLLVFDDAFLGDADLCGLTTQIQLFRTNLRSAQLRGTVFGGIPGRWIEADSTNFTEADLRGADLWVDAASALAPPDFQNAHMQDADVHVRLDPTVE